MIAAGMDLVEIDRIAAVISRHGWRFFERCFTIAELVDADGRLESIAARFAAKEAAVKALGTGIGRIGWHDVEVLLRSSGQPELHLHGEARHTAERLHLRHFSVSLTHTEHYAAAVVVASGADSPERRPYAVEGNQEV